MRMFVNSDSIVPDVFDVCEEPLRPDCADTDAWGTTQARRPRQSMPNYDQSGGNCLIMQGAPEPTMTSSAVGNACIAVFANLPPQGKGEMHDPKPKSVSTPLAATPCVKALYPASVTTSHLCAAC